ncbi:MAG TPA: ATP-binding protein [Longimicrobiaceae bacterium]
MIEESVLDPVPTEAPRRAGRAWIGSLALGLVLVSLTLSLLAPVLVQRRIGAVRAEIDGSADPARTLVSGIQFALAREMSALRGFLITGQEEFLEAYSQALAREEDAYRRLQPLAHVLGAEVSEELAELHTLSAEWHRRVSEDEVVRRREASPALVAGIPTEQELYEKALLAARDLDAAVGRAARVRGARIRELERIGLVVTAGVVLLAFASSLVVARLGWQLRRLAREAEERRLEAERALRETRRNMESRHRLLRGITHDIKNPLGAADGYAELLLMGLRGPISPAQAVMVGSVRRCIANALGIIQDLIEISRAEGGDLPIEWSRVDLAALVRSVAEEYHGAATAAGKRIETGLPPGPVLVHADAGRVRQIVGNLLSNALKYAHGSDRIVLAVGREADVADSGREWGAVRVVDFGPGIARSELEKIFLEFYRIPSTGGEGSGLGLAISRRIARLLGGDLTVSSEPGQGAVFTLRLPVADEPGE